MAKKSFVHIYTGDGKGKTTAAVGLACRARGHNLAVCYISFHKDPQKWGYGEHFALEKLGVDVFAFAKEHPYFSKNADVEGIRKECRKGLNFIKDIFQQNKYDLVILDEIVISVRDGFLEERQILELIKQKPQGLELVLTGRGAGDVLIKNADLVSFVRKIKHPFDEGKSPGRGIDF